jgi:hypothetical protein
MFPAHQIHSFMGVSNFLASRRSTFSLRLTISYDPSDHIKENDKVGTHESGNESKLYSAHIMSESSNDLSIYWR